MFRPVVHPVFALLAAFSVGMADGIQTEIPAPANTTAPLRSFSSADLGADAAAAGLWEIAAGHFEHALRQARDPAERQALATRLVEAWIRDRRPELALSSLNDPLLASHPAKMFWQAQALAALGRFNEAAEAFQQSLHQPGTPYPDETALSLAQIRISLGQPDQALDVLQVLAGSSRSNFAITAKLWISRLLIDQGRVAEARNSLPSVESSSQQLQAEAQWTEAHLLLAENRPQDAASRFKSLLDHPEGLSLSLYHDAAVGFASALVRSGQSAQAVKWLLEFIQKHPDSPELAGLFALLDRLMPEKPALNDPILDQLLQWIPPAEVPAAGPLNLSGGGAESAITAPGDADDDRAAFALFSRSCGLRRNGTPEALEAAKRLLNRLRWEHPEHFLARTSLLESARHLMGSRQTALAFSLLDSLREHAPAASVQGEAAFLEARHAFEQGNLRLAASLFDEAAEELDETPARIAALNAAVARLRYDSNDTTLIQASRSEDPQLQADVQLERALCTSEPASRRSALEEFLTAHPNHPRASEARLSAAEAALSTPQPDLSFARAQLDTLQSESPTTGQNDTRFAAVALRIADLGNDTDAAIATARDVMQRFNGQSVANEAALVLGRKWFDTRNYNNARMVLEKFAASCGSPDRAQAAWLLAARSAALIPTTQSRREALILLDKVIDAGLALAPVAKLEKARLWIDLNQLKEAEEFLIPWFSSLQPSDPLYLSCGLLLGEAIYAQGKQRQDSLDAALAVYDQLLIQAQRASADFNRIQYLRGLTLEQLADPADPSRSREKQALSAYYSVLETTPPPAEWHYFELCGFRALSMLEKSSRWQAAIACARKIAAFHGPRAKEAADRAEQIQLQQMIWED